MRKRLLSTFLVLALLVTIFEGKTISYAESSGLSEAEERAYWSQFTSHLYDDTLTSQEMAKWKAWEEACLDAMVTETDLAMHTCSDANCGNKIFAQLPGYFEDSDYMTFNDRAFNVSRMFYYSHPQFYFLNRWTRAYPIGTVYKKFKDGKERRKKTLELKAQIDQWIADTKAGAASSNPLDLEKEAHDLICEEVSKAQFDYVYGEDSIAAGFADEGTASAFLIKKGTSIYYAYAFNMLLRGMGIEAAVAGAQHYMDSVSIVVINGKYYYADPYTDDKGSYISRGGLNVSLDELRTKGGRSYDDRTKIVGDYSLNSKAVASSDIWTGKNRCLKPTITILGDESIKLTAVNTSEKIYYTLNNSKPTTSSSLYKNPVISGSALVLKAISASSGFDNSRIAQTAVSSTKIGYLKYESIHQGSSGSMEQVTCRTDSPIILAENKYTRVGYTFAGWNTKADGTGTAYNSGQKVSGLIIPAEITKLYAQWKPIKYNIAFNKNGGKGTTIKTIKDCYYDQAYQIPTSNLTKTSYSFAGWNTKKDGSGIDLADGAAAQNLLAQPGTVTLYAQWEAVTYKIKYHLDGGENSDKNPPTYSPVKSLTLKNPTKDGYIFKGWYTDSAFKKKKSTISKGSTGNKDFYAKWQGNPYTIKFYSNNATKGKTADVKCQYGKEHKLTANGYSKKGKTFAGWNTKKDGSGESYKNGETIKNLTSKKNGIIKLYAQWK